jgi:hypothetical protein
MLTVHLASRRPIERPRYVWLGVAIELLTAITAVPVGLALMLEPTGKGIGLPYDWIQASVFGTYFVPGLYLFAINGLGMVVAAALTAIGHWLAPWLQGVLSVGLIVWILVQLLIMPEVMWLQWVFLGAGLVLGFINLFWMRRTAQLRLW